MKSIFRSRAFALLCSLAIISTSGYALSTVYSYGVYVRIAFAYVFLFPIIIQIRRGIDRLFVAFLLCAVMVVVTFLAAGDRAIGMYVSFLATIIFALGVVIVYEFQDFLTIYLRSMTIVSAVSLIGHYLVNAGQGILSLPTVYNINLIPYAVGGIFFYIVSIPSRNIGIFWEPGLFASFLILALVFELHYRKGRPRIVNIVLYVAAVVTTQSSAGYGLLLFVFSIVLIRASIFIKDTGLRIVVRVSVIALSIALLLHYPTVFELVGVADNPTIQRLAGESLAGQSRLLAVGHNLNMFLRNPIFGNGFAESYSHILYVADTSTSTFMLSVFGILGIQYTLYWIYGVVKGKGRDMPVSIMVALVILLIVNKEPHHNLVASWCLMFYFIKDTMRPGLLPGRVDQGTFTPSLSQNRT